MSGSQSPQRLAKYEPRYVPQELVGGSRGPVSQGMQSPPRLNYVSSDSRKETPSPQRLSRFDPRYVPLPQTASDSIVPVSEIPSPKKTISEPSPQRLGRFEQRYVPQPVSVVKVTEGDLLTPARDTDSQRQKSSPSPQRLARYDLRYVPQRRVAADGSDEFLEAVDQYPVDKSYTSPQSVSRHSPRYVPQSRTAAEDTTRTVSDSLSPGSQKSSPSSPQRLARFEPRYVPQPLGASISDVAATPPKQEISKSPSKRVLTSPIDPRYINQRTPTPTSSDREPYSGTFHGGIDPVKFVAKPFKSEPCPLLQR
eukprot:TRINITY_DN34093_c0_g1_i1.p1 TRINITY_DN34093_c0_g1~~TRINITY_DN34093_c0_g1_i1.p1  ORF type:complete len:310 (+),score=25.95 TRINITY_DN34093_c0_g1_i1:31-960(+)